MYTTINEYKQFLINEYLDTIIKLKLIVSYDKKLLNKEELLSKIRAARGITIVTIVDNENTDNNKLFLNVKIDNTVFTNLTIKTIKKELNLIYGLNIISIKFGEFN